MFGRRTAVLTQPLNFISMKAPIKLVSIEKPLDLVKNRFISVFETLF